ncbi:DUF421 domain-containing protein, partial [Serratia marcescens]|nr:DUF421 domain-containing protein [Serratia marcescens]
GSSLKTASFTPGGSELHWHVGHFYIGTNTFQEVNYAQIEPNGQITVVCDGAKMPSVIVMKDGKARIAELSSIEKDEAWLACKLKDAGIDPHAVFLAEFWSGKLSFILNNGEVKFSL